MAHPHKEQHERPPHERILERLDVIEEILRKIEDKTITWDYFFIDKETFINNHI